MKATGIVLGTLLVIGLLVGIVVYAPKAVPVTASDEPAKPVKPDGAPDVSPTPPWPKAEFDTKEVVFKIMEVGESREKKFIVTNKGEAPLILAKGPTTCQCTLSEVATKPIPPGGTGEILLKWKPEVAVEMFEKGVTIYTNDPKQQSVYLSIRGEVTERLMLSPTTRVWEILDVTPNKPATYTGRLYSRTLPEFKITKVETGNPNLKVEVNPLPPADREELRTSVGYKIDVTVEPEKAAGGFSYPFTLTTDQKERTREGALSDKDLQLQITVKGIRRGAVKFIGKGYDEPDGAMAIGSFSASKGSSRDFRMIISRVPEGGVKIESVKVEPEHLKLEVLPIGEYKPGKPQNFTLHFTYPPQGPVMLLDPANPGKVTIKTNHPELQEINLKAYVNAY